MLLLSFTKRLFCGSVLLVLAIAATSQSAKPNVLFIFADDQSFETLRAYGNTEIETPNLDRLARDGISFTHAYNMGSWSGAVCVASRTMLNTGRFLWHAHEIYDQSEQERQAGRFWSEYLKKAGYHTYFTGKWHVKADAEKAFNVARHVRPGMPNQTELGYNRPLPNKPDAWKPWDPRFEGFWKGGTHWSEIVASDAVEFLQQANEQDHPFFMYVAFNAPHDPRQSPREYVERYPLQQVGLPVNFLSIYPYCDSIGCGRTLRDERLAPFPRTAEAVKVHRQEYYAIITHMDAQIGRILNALRKSHKADNTYVVFTADHGLAVGHHGLMGKQNMYDHSVRVPFLVKGPNVARGRQIATPIYLQDAMPTTLDLAQVDLPNHVQFKSLMPLLKEASNASEHYESIYGAYLQLQRMVISNGLKLILYPTIQKVRLYDLRDDPQETRDLAENPEFQPQIKSLFAELLRLQKQTGDTLDISAAFPKI